MSGSKSRALNRRGRAKSHQSKRAKRMRQKQYEIEREKSDNKDNPYIYKV